MTHHRSKQTKRRDPLDMVCSPCSPTKQASKASKHHLLMHPSCSLCPLPGIDCRWPRGRKKTLFFFCVAQCNQSKLGNRVSGAILVVFTFSWTHCLLRFLHNSLNSTNKGDEWMNGLDGLDGWGRSFIFHLFHTTLSLAYCSKTGATFQPIHPWEGSTDMWTNNVEKI